MALIVYRFGILPRPIAVFLVSVVAWYCLYPKRFDARVQKYTKKQMRESSFTKM